MFFLVKGWGNEISVLGPIKNHNRKKIITEAQEMKDSKLLTRWPKITSMKQTNKKISGSFKTRQNAVKGKRKKLLREVRKFPSQKF